MDWSRIYTEGVKVWLAGGAVFLALVWPWVDKKWTRQALAFLVVIAGINYARWGTEAAVERLDAYDVLHYYVNAKYFDELGYLDLYPAVLLVDADNDGPFFQQGQTYLAQDELGHHLRPIQHGLDRGREVRDERFTPERWDQFEHDVLYLQRTIGCRDRSRDGTRCVRELDDTLWRQLINDHGFNGTTAWTVLAKPLASAVPVEGLKALGYLDVALLGAAIVAVAWAYGGTAAGWTALFLLTTYSTRWPYFSWVFLRYDYVAALIFATAFLKKGRPWIAGAFAGWAAVLRMFPAMWMWGPLGKGLAALVRGRLHVGLLKFGGAFLITAAVLQGTATVVLGPDQVATHFHNMLDHNDAKQLSSRRIGLALALATDPWRAPVEKIISPQRKERIEAQRPLRFLIAGGLMVALAWGLRRQRNDEAFAFGFLPFFLLTTASYYYYVTRITLVVVHAGDLDRSWRHRVGLASLFGLEVFSNAAQRWHDGERLFLIGNLAWGLVLYAVVQVGWLLVESHRRDRAE